MAKKKAKKKTTKKSSSSIGLNADLAAILGANSSLAPSVKATTDYGFLDAIKSTSSPKFSSINWDGFGDDWEDANSKKNKGTGINLWDVLTGTLGQVGGLVTDSIYRTIDTATDDKKSVGEKLLSVLYGDGGLAGSLVGGVKAGAKAQLEDWTNGKMNWGDIPAVGFLHGMDKNWKRGTDIAKDQMKIKNRWGSVGTGIALDIALDPLTYMTGGVSAASKMAKVAEAKKIAELASDLKMTGKFKNADEFLNAAEDVVRTKYSKYANLTEKMVTKKIKDYTNEIKTARNTVFNANVNKIGVKAPFMNKYALTDMSKRNLLYRSESNAPAELVRELLQKAAKSDPIKQKQLENLVQTRYGVSSLDELTKTHFDDLSSKLESVMTSKVRGIPEVKVTQQIVEKAMPQEDFARIMNEFRKQNITWDVVKNQLNDILLQTSHDPLLRSSVGAHLAELTADYWRTVTKGMRGVPKAVRAQRAESMKWAEKLLRESDKYKTVETKVDDIFKNGDPSKIKALQDKEFYKGVADIQKTPFNEAMNGKTNFEHMLDKVNPFDARTLATGDKFVDSMGNHIADASSQRIGETAMFDKALSGIEDIIKKGKITDDEMKQAIYVLEKHHPSSLGKNWTPSRKVQQLANALRPVIDEIGQGEKSAGVLDKLRANYFPHVLKGDAKLTDEVKEFMKKNKQFNGQKSTSKFNNKRKTFETLAEADNYIEKLEKAIQKATDPDTIKSLRAQQKRVADMFDTDVVSALTKRIREGTRAKAMKAMQGKLSKYGMMKTIKKGSKDPEPAGLTKLEPDVARKLGLGEGTHFIHPKVLDGMKRTDEIFTDEGMNKFVRHVSAINDIWRPLVTYYKPSHYTNNLIGNFINNLAAGVKARDYKKAGKLLYGYHKGTLSPAEMRIMKKAYKHNVIAGGFLFDSKPNLNFDTPSGLEKAARAVGDNKGIRVVRKKGEQIDDISRLANFVNGLDKFGETEKAARQVREYLFNYNELTKADRTMRVAVPFWNWTKRNVPLQMKTLLENPKFAMNIERFKNLFNDGEKGEDWQKKTGIKVNDDYYTSIPSPTHDLNLLLHPSENLGSMTPAARMPLELMMNKKLFTGRPISYGSDSVIPEDYPQYLLSNLGLGGNAYDAFSGKKTAGESIINLFKNISRINEVGG